MPSTYVNWETCSAPKKRPAWAPHVHHAHVHVHFHAPLWFLKWKQKEPKASQRLAPIPNVQGYVVNLVFVMDIFYRYVVKLWVNSNSCFWESWILRKWSLKFFFFHHFFAITTLNRFFFYPKKKESYLKVKIQSVLICFKNGSGNLNPH